MNADNRSSGRVAIVAGVLCLLALLMAGTWALVSAGDAGAPAAPGAEQPAAATSTAAAPAPAAGLAVLRQPASASDQLPPLALGASARLAHADPAGARLALQQESRDVFVVPAAEGDVCLASLDHSIGGCFDASPAEAEPQSQVVICSPFKPAGELLLYGVVPDGVTGLSAELADGSRVRVPSEGNVFLLSVPRRDPLPLRLRWTDAGGAERSAESGVPADAGDDACETSRTPAEAEAELARQWREHGDELEAALADTRLDDAGAQQP